MKLPTLTRSLVCATALFGLALAELSYALDLPTAVTRTLKASPQLALYPYHVRASEAEALQAGLKPNPTMNVDLENAFGTGDSRFLSGHELALSLSQVLEMGKKRERRVDLVGQKTAQIQREYEVKRLDVVAATLRDFYQVLRLQELMAWNRQRLVTEQAALDIIKRRAQAGVVGQADVMRMQLRLSKSLTQQRTLTAQHEQALNTLAANWAEVPDFTEVDGELSLLPDLPDQATLSGAINNTPDFLKAQAKTRIEGARLALAQAESKADMTVGAGVRRFEDNDDLALLFSFSMPLQWYDHNQGNQAKALAQFNASLAEEALLTQQVSVALSGLRAVMHNTLQHTQTLESELKPVAEALLKEVERGYQSGLYSVLQWVDAQNELFAVERELIESHHAVQLQFLELERLTGNSLSAGQQTEAAYKE